MSLFFYKEGSNKILKGQRDLENGYKYECRVCSLNNTPINSPRMPPTGSKHPSLYNIGEAPGKTEDENNEQFIGKSGEILRGVMSEVFDIKFLKREVRWNNVVRCHPNNNRTPTAFEIACCSKSVETDILNTRPKIVIGYGNVPLKKFLNIDGGIFTWRGRHIPVKIQDYTFWFMPMLHPAYIVRRDKKNEEVQDRVFSHMFKIDMLNVKKVLESEEVPKVISSGYEKGIRYIIQDSDESVNIIAQYLDELAQEQYVAIDIETHADPRDNAVEKDRDKASLKPWNPNSMILSIALSNYKKTIAFPLHVMWSKKRQEKVEKMLVKFLKNNTIKVAHNSKFELTWLNYFYGTDVICASKWYDTQGLAMAFDERPGGKNDSIADLGTQTLIHFGFNLKSLTEGTIDRTQLKTLVDTGRLKELLIYNGMDSKYEHKLLTKQIAVLPKDLRWTFNHTNKLARTLAITESVGLPLDLEIAKKYSKDYEVTMKDIESKISKRREVKEFEKMKHTPFKLGSNTQLITVFRDILKVEQIKTTPKGGFCVDEETLNAYSNKGIELASLIIQHRKASKQKSTYVDSIVDKMYDDGLIRPDYMHLFVVTGRLSATSPPIQTFPKRENKQARAIITAPKDHHIVAIDYGQIEARVIATVSRDAFYCDALKTGYDIHLEWAKRIAKRMKLTLNKDELKKFRSDVKNMWTFPAFYGSSLDSIEAAFGVSQGTLKREFKEFWEQLADVKVWQEKMIQFYYDNGYVKSAFGRRRHAPLSKNEILNTPIQSAASDIVTDAMNRLSELSIKRKDPMLQPIWNIHDDLGFFIHDDVLEEYIEIIAEQMCCVPYDWITVPISAEVSVGKHWHELKEIITYDTRDFKKTF